MGDNEQIDKLYNALQCAEKIFMEAGSREVTKGFVIQRREVNPVKDAEKSADLLTYDEYHPFLFEQHKHSPYVEHNLFNKSVDEFFSKLESQKIDMKALQIEKGALKRLENVREDHRKRVDTLKDSQDKDMMIAELIEVNLQEVERAIATINSAIANQIDWEEIQEIVDEAKGQGDPVAILIKSLNLGANQIVLS